MLSKFARLSVVRKLAIVVLLVNAVVFVTLTAFVFHRTSSIIQEQAEADLFHEIDLLTATFDVFDRNIIQSTKALGNVFFNMFPNGVQLEEGQTSPVGAYEAPVLSDAGEALNMDFTTPDAFTNVTGGNATVFVRYGDDFLRISTSLKKESGERATGTLLGKNHPGYRQLINGETYLGKARLFGRDYMTEYKPIKDRSGRVIAILYVGFDFTDVFTALKETLNGIAFSDSGFVFLANAAEGAEQGKLLIHPSLEGKNLMTLTDGEGRRIYNDMFQQNRGVLRFNSADDDGQAHIAVFKRIEHWNFVVGMDAPLKEITALSGQLSWELSAFTSLAAVVIVVVLFLIMKKELAPLRGISEILVRVGKGDLAQTLNTDPSDKSRLLADDTCNEIMLLETSVDDMIGHFRGLVSGINGTTELLNQSANDLTGLTEQAHHNLADQRNRTDQVATAVTEMTASIQEVAANVASAAGSTQEANNRTREGQAIVADVEHSIKNVADQVEQAAGVINDLNLESENIGTVLDVIRGIAEQTNLLALNAAIEAARAGDQGRGFAVVADEVRGLAQRTQKSTQEIQQMIERLQTEAGTAVSHMETSRDYGQESVEKAMSAANALAAIETSAAQISDMITQVASAAEQQSVVAEEINGNIVGIRDLSEHTAESAGETAQSSEQMAALAHQLKESVGRFRM